MALYFRVICFYTLLAYIAGDIKPEPQDTSQVTFSPNIKPEDEKLDWNKINFVNSLTKRGMKTPGLSPILLLGERFKIYLKPSQ